MRKDFKSWNSLKQNIDQKDVDPFFYIREIWWTHVGVNIGSEISGKNEGFERPVLVFNRYNKDTFLGIPLTSNPHPAKYHISVRVNNKEYFLNISQMRVFSSKRLIRKITTVDEEQFYMITGAITKSFHQNESPVITGQSRSPKAEVPQ